MHVTYSPLIYSTTELSFKQNDENITTCVFRISVSVSVEREREREREISRAEIDISYIVLYT